MQMKLTMQGMYDYDPTIFDSWTMPEDMDRQTAIDAILFRAGEFEVLYPQLPFLKDQIGKWGARHNRTFEKWLEALAVEFNPLENYDRYEEYMDENWGNGSSSGSSGSELQVSAYDEAQYSNREKTTDSSSGSSNSHMKTQHTAHLHGNIGVTTSATMLSESLEVQKFSFYDAVADLFVQDFCIMIY